MSSGSTDASSKVESPLREVVARGLYTQWPMYDGSVPFTWNELPQFAKEELLAEADAAIATSAEIGTNLALVRKNIASLPTYRTPGGSTFVAREDVFALLSDALPKLSVPVIAMTPRRLATLERLTNTLTEDQAVSRSMIRRMLADARAQIGRLPDVDALVVAAVVWWRRHKPASFTDAEHLHNAKINTTTDAEANLAQAVADHLRAVNPVDRS